jgi:hypothetical protein
MLSPLPIHIHDLWLRYRRLEGHAFRHEIRDSLTVFIDDLLQLPVPTWELWALSVAAEFVDRGGYQVRDMLFERVVFPALLRGINDRKPNCARWLGGMAQHLYRCPKCMEQLGPALSFEEALFRLALTVDPADAGARKGLIKAMARQFWYSLHELPSGVLFGHDGATPSQCGELRSDLSEFEKLVAVEEKTTEYAGLIEKCRYHFTAYEQYLTRRPKTGDYADFIEASGGEPGLRT